jgi:anti-anti-sigma factor
MTTGNCAAAAPPQDVGGLRMGSFRDGDTHVITLAGELCLETADEVQQELRRVELTCVHVIAIDLREVTCIDSMGIRLIVQAQWRSSQGSNRLIVIRGSEAVQELFEICGLAARLPFVDALPCSDAATRSAATATGRIGVTAAGTRAATRAAIRSRVGQASLAAAVRKLRTRPRRAIG